MKINRFHLFFSIMLFVPVAVYSSPFYFPLNYFNPLDKVASGVFTRNIYSNIYYVKANKYFDDGSYIEAKKMYKKYNDYTFINYLENNKVEKEDKDIKQKLSENRIYAIELLQYEVQK